MDYRVGIMAKCESLHVQRNGMACFLPFLGTVPFETKTNQIIHGNLYNFYEKVSLDMLYTQAKRNKNKNKNLIWRLENFLLLSATIKYYSARKNRTKTSNIASLVFFPLNGLLTNCI